MGALLEFQDICQKRIVTNFAKQILKESYSECIPVHKALIGEFVDEVFLLLDTSYDNSDVFSRNLEELRVRLFHNQKESFWFNHHYGRYKQLFKPQYRVQGLENLSIGPKILDFGCGKGATSLALSEKGHQVFLVDEIDYRDQSVKHLPFFKITEDNVLPFPDSFFDEVIVFGVLHHVEAYRLEALLSEIARVSRRIIVEEDVYSSTTTLDSVTQKTSYDEQLLSYENLTPENQKNYLEFLDYYANIIVQGIENMNMPLAFRTIQEWQIVFEKQGLFVVDLIPKGFQKHYFHRSNHFWFELAKH